MHSNKFNARRAFNIHEFAKIASRHETDFSDFGTMVTEKDRYGEDRSYTYKDNGSDVLAVAHLDTVQEASYSSIIKVRKEPVLLSPRLDDRLGVYIILKLLPLLGITADWLLTTGEEVGQSTAELFTTEKEYNWAFSFDRAGTDVVLYQYDHKALRKLLRRAGFKLGQGSFSDLSFLDIGCSGINFGTGYHDAHSLHAYAYLADTFAMVERFRKFWRAYSKVRLPYRACSPSTSYMHSGYGYGYSSLPKAYQSGYREIDYGSGYRNESYGCGYRNDWGSQWNPQYGCYNWEIQGELEEIASEKGVGDWQGSKYDISQSDSQLLNGNLTLEEIEELKDKGELP